MDARRKRPESATAAQDKAAELEAFVLEQIPLARAMQLSLRAWHGDSIELHAPLAANVNDKGCAFGGSLSSLMTLASWALLELNVRDAGLDADIFVADADIRYLAPVFDDLDVLAVPEEGQDLNRFLSVLRQRGRARIGMRSVVDGNEGPACVQQARFVAKLRR
ncbi:MAG: YiiD C-terminal domain-containing protein [Rhodanobacteraceae bacterium]